MAARIWWVLPALLLVAGPSDALAKNGRGTARGERGNGPAFCRSGAGHPVHGRAWCRDKGWDRRGGLRDIWFAPDDDRDRENERRERERERDRRERDRDGRVTRFPWPF